MSKCPHEHIQYCPIYLESHYGRGMGCVDDLSEPCKVERGIMQYESSKALIIAINPRECAIQKFNEDAFYSKQQRSRNMRAAGIQ